MTVGVVWGSDSGSGVGVVTGEWCGDSDSGSGVG